MTNTDVFKVLLCSYGYDRNIKIESYRGDSGELGYSVYAENKTGDSYNEICCENFMFHVYLILKFMKENNVGFKSDYWSYPTKYVIDDNSRNNIIANLDERDTQLAKDLEELSPVIKWRDDNNPCINCKINKHDHWDDIHYNCELCHTNSCELLKNFQNEYRKILSKRNT
ncbi:MAG: hypothetical protein WC979_03270 [Candidatus Pacearchaeota archaeon]|jgi:hypothetical protein|nr:hypothetical protein [Clostridia bacterium]